VFERLCAVHSVETAAPERQRLAKIAQHKRKRWVSRSRAGEHGRREIEAYDFSAESLESPAVAASSTARVEDCCAGLAVNLTKDGFFLENDLRIWIGVIACSPAFVRVPRALTHTIPSPPSMRKASVQDRDAADIETRKCFI
jgi:hypothetical protein